MKKNNKKKGNLATITWKQVIVTGEKRFEMVGCENVLKEEELPSQYLEGDVYFYRSRYTDRRIFYRDKGSIGVRELEVGDTCTVEKYNVIMDIFKKAGAELARINKEIRQVRKTWNKEFTVTI